MVDGLPSSSACLRNQGPILEVLEPFLRQVGSVLEIGCGTGQHAAWFIPALPHLRWQTSSLPEDLVVIRRWLAEAGTAAPEPMALDVNIDEQWPAGPFDAAYTANTCHIMSWPAVKKMFRGVARLLKPGGQFIVYGPFMIGGVHTGEGNRRFDIRLRAGDPAAGIRDIDELTRHARTCDLQLQQIIGMPADNRILVWERFSGRSRRRDEQA